MQRLGGDEAWRVGMQGRGWRCELKKKLACVSVGEGSGKPGGDRKSVV